MMKDLEIVRGRAPCGEQVEELTQAGKSEIEIGQEIAVYELQTVINVKDQG